MSYTNRNGIVRPMTSGDLTHPDVEEVVTRYVDVSGLLKGTAIDAVLRQNIYTGPVFVGDIELIAGKIRKNFDDSKNFSNYRLALEDAENMNVKEMGKLYGLPEKDRCAMNIESIVNLTHMFHEINNRVSKYILEKFPSFNSAE